MSSSARESGSLVALAGSRYVRIGALTMAILLLLAGSATVLVAYEAADRVIHPERELRRATPASRGLEFERVAFESTDGVPLVGWWMPATEPTIGTVIFLHGYTASKSQSLSVAPFLVRNGFHVLAFDFRAHGESGGAFTSVGLLEAEDVLAAVAFAKEKSDAPIALFGWSMGAAAALNAAPHAPDVRAVVADSAFARLTNAISNELPSATGLPRFPFVPLILLFASAMTRHSPGENEPAREAGRLERPLLVIQGERDALAHPDADGGELARAAGSWADLWLVPEAGHVDARRVDPREYERRVVAFLEEHLR